MPKEEQGRVSCCGLRRHKIIESHWRRTEDNRMRDGLMICLQFVVFVYFNSKLTYFQACTECPYVTDGKGTLEEHFQRRDGDLRPCDICKLPLRNQCVFSAHMRMHRHATPQTCPECGQTFDG